MKPLRSVALAILLISSSAGFALAQPESSAGALREQIVHLERMAASRDTPPAMAASTRRLLAIKRAQLSTSLRMQLDALRKYQASYGQRFSEKETQSVNRSIQLLESELENLRQPVSPVSTAAHVQRISRDSTTGVFANQTRNGTTETRANSISKPTTVGSFAPSPESTYRSGEVNTATLLQAKYRSRSQLSAEQSRPYDECAGVPAENHIYLDWKSGSISPSRLKRPGTHCFILTNANTILYSYSFAVNVRDPQDNPLALLKNAIDQLKNLFPGAVDPAAKLGRRADCGLPEKLTILKQKSSELETVVSALLPAISGGKIPSIPLETTRVAWNAVASKFGPVRAAAIELETRLRTADNAVCPDEIKLAKQALENFYRAETVFLVLESRVRTPPVARFRDDLDNTKGYDVVVKELYEGQPTEAATKTYHLTAGYSVITSSAGFMLTQVPARSYSSVTAPNPANPTTTQNVLGVDFASGRRLVLTALLNYNLPFFLRRQFGIALSAGPVFDITGGKADTSRFGFFAGPSVRLSEWVYVSPGVHIGEFADFPLGFTPGQVIPTGTGTPVPVKRYTTRFALGITFKVKDLVGSSSSSSSTTPASQPGAK
jgi:hypothetical protein